MNSTRLAPTIAQNRRKKSGMLKNVSMLPNCPAQIKASSLIPTTKPRNASREVWNSGATRKSNRTSYAR